MQKCVCVCVCHLKNNQSSQINHFTFCFSPHHDSAQLQLRWCLSNFATLYSKWLHLDQPPSTKNYCLLQATGHFSEANSLPKRWLRAYTWAPPNLRPNFSGASHCCWLAQRLAVWVATSPQPLQPWCACNFRVYCLREKRAPTLAAANWHSSTAHCCPVERARRDLGVHYHWCHFGDFDVCSTERGYFCECAECDPNSSDRSFSPNCPPPKLTKHWILRVPGLILTWFGEGVYRQCRVRWDCSWASRAAG